MAIRACISTVVSSIRAADNREGRATKDSRFRSKTSSLTETSSSREGRRALLTSALAAAAQLTDSQSELLKKYLKKSQENKAKNDKERLDSYYKRNYMDYFRSEEGMLKAKKEPLTETEKGILDWLQANK